MSFELTSGVAGCVVSDQVVLFDIKANEYLALTAPANDAFVDWLAGAKLTPFQIEALFELIEAGVLEADPIPPRGVASPLPKESLLDRDLPPYAGKHLLRAVAAQCEASLVLHLGAIKGAMRYLNAVRAKHQNQTQPSCSTVETWTNATLMAQAFVPSHDKCLRRSLAMALLLARDRITAQLVFGVKLNTFAAHAWVQVGDVVLNDAVDHVARYTPILVV